MPKRVYSNQPRSTRPPQAPVRQESFDCEADVLEGLERFAQAEIVERLGVDSRLIASERAGAVRFRYAGDLRLLLDLRSIVAIYVVRRFAVPRPRALLGHQHFEALLRLIATTRSLAPPESYQTLHLSAAGAESSVLTRLKFDLCERTGLALAPDEGDLLLRLRRAVGALGWEVLVRLSPRPLATRPWRVCNMPGALNATLAHCMMRLSEPTQEDILINLACGSGTLLVERLALGAARSLIGCDIQPTALDCARSNLHAAGFDGLVRLELWEAGRLPLPDASVNMICADLPFGQLVGSHRQNEVLYPQIFAEAMRIAAPGARMVLLTHEVRLLERVAAQYVSQWQLHEVLPVRAGGMTPRVYLFRVKA
jgi:ubiquinone/menaquinone biosynthesis C-methylase UbiE